MMAGMLTVTMLIAVRLMPIFVVAPISSFRRVPIFVRLILIFSISFILASSFSQHFSHYHNVEKVDLFRYSVTEFVIGSSLAFSFHAASAAMHMMGQQIDLQIGFAAGAIFDPSTEQTTTPTGEVLTLGLLVSLIILNVHHDLLLGFSKLLHVAPPGKHLNWSDGWLRILGKQFTLGFIIASPIIITLWFVDLALAFVSRSLPQAQVYFVGLPVKVFVGIVVLAWFMNHALEPFNRLMTQSLLLWDEMFRI